MFLMMNEARLAVGLQALGLASASYMYALEYAKQRIQGKDYARMRDLDAPSVPIIRHPDVRRQLSTMKAYVDGMRSILYYASLCLDRIEISTDADEKEKRQGILDVLIPIAKGYVSGRAFEVCSQGVQVYGGYGYIKDYPVEQLLRDCRITMIYEGTNGIQAMDLLGRKLGMKGGKPVMDLFGEMRATIALAKQAPSLGEMAAELEKALGSLAEAAMHLGAVAMSPQAMNALAFAHPFMEGAGDVIVAWMLLWRATAAAKRLETIAVSPASGARREEAGKGQTAAFYEGQLKTAEFFISSMLPIAVGRLKTVAGTNGAVMEIPEAAF